MIDSIDFCVICMKGVRIMKITVSKQGDICLYLSKNHEKEPAFIVRINKIRDEKTVLVDFLMFILVYLIFFIFLVCCYNFF